MGKDTVDPYGVGQHEMGAKLDKGKDPIAKGVFDYFPRSLRRVARLSNTGAIKYMWGSWSAVEDSVDRYREASARHVFDLCEGETFDLTYIDPETGDKYYHHHQVSVVWNALATLEKMLDDPDLVTEYVEKK